METHSDDPSVSNVEKTSISTRWLVVAILVSLFLIGLYASSLVFRSRLEHNNKLGPNVSEIKRLGAIVIGTDPAKNLIGVDNDLSFRIASELGLEAEIEFFKNAELFEALDSKDADIVISGIVYSDQIIQKYDVSSVYLYAGEIKYVVLFRKGDSDLVNEINQVLLRLRDQGVLETYQVRWETR